jgi:ADP-heptose:LPS heptosyltransferase
MEKVVERLGEQDNLRIFFFGAGKTEQQQFNDWAAKWPFCVNASGQLGGLQQELALMSQLDVMLTMDSANMHLASLVGIPVVSVWGATHPYAGFMGWNQKVENAIQLDLDCRPCSIFGQKPCRRGDYACLNNIKPTTIVEKINSILLTKQNT